MTRSITDDIPGWGSFFNGRAGDGTVSVSTTLNYIIPLITINKINLYINIFH